MRAGHFESSDSVFSPAELEFFAEEELITVIPKISTAEKDEAGREGHLSLLSGTTSLHWLVALAASHAKNLTMTVLVQAHMASLSPTGPLMCPFGWPSS